MDRDGLTDHMKSNGIDLSDGKKINFRDYGKFQRWGKKSRYWLTIHNDKAASYGDWKEDVKFDYFDPSSNEFERRKAKDFIEENQELKYLKAAFEAEEEWQSLSEDGHSKYLEEKHLSAVDGIRFGTDEKGSFIATALIDSHGEISSLQKIYDYDFSFKPFLKGSKTRGCYAEFKNIGNNGVIYICEGVATALSILLAKPNSLVIAAYSCGNLEFATKNILAKYQNREIIIAGDNDEIKGSCAGNKKAMEIGKKFGLKVILPTFKEISTKPSDFNDLHKLEKIEEVARQLDKADYSDPEPILFSLNHPETELDAEKILGKNTLTQFAIEVSRSTETPIEFSIISILCCLAACLQNKAAVKITNDWKEPLVIQGTILGKSGDGKSPVFNHVIRPLLEWESSKMEGHEKDLKAVHRNNEIIEDKIKKLMKESHSKKNKGKSDTEELKKKITELDGEKQKEPPSPRIIVQDITPEQITKKLERQGGKIGIFDHEGGFFNTMAGRYSNGIPNLDVLLKGYNGSELMVDRADRSIRIPEAFVSTCIFIQPGMFRCIKNLQQLLDSGLLSRALYANPKSKVGFREFKEFEISKESKDAYYNLVNQLLEQKNFITLELSKDAKIVFKEFQLKIEAKRRPGEEYDSNNAIGSWVEKIKGNAARIAGILQLVEDGTQNIISENIMIRAINFAEILIEHALSIFSYLGSDKDTMNAIKLWDYLEDKDISKFSSSDLQQAKKGDSSFSNKEDFDKALLILTERNLILKIESSKEDVGFGRPESTKYRINSKTKK